MPDPTDPNFFDLDALETYGPVELVDGDMCSFAGDPAADPGHPGVKYSVYEYNNGNPIGWIPHDSIVKAVEHLGYVGNEDYLDLDALMCCKYGPQSNWWIIFSIRAAENWDGGEIVVMPVIAPGSAEFLEHGDHIWNTAFDVQAAFVGANTEEVDGIEAWGPGEDDPPPPGGKGLPALTNWGLLVLLVLLVISGIIVIRHRRRGVVRA